MTFTLLILLFGSLLGYAGWTNLRVLSLVRGDNSKSANLPVPK